MPIDMSMLAPGGQQQGMGMPQPGGAMPAEGAPQGGPQGQMGNPGAMEALKAGIKYLMDQGLSIEQIIEAMLKVIEMNPNMNIPEEQVRQIVEQTAQDLGGQTQSATPGQMGPQM